MKTFSTMAARLVLVFALLGTVISAQAQYSVTGPVCQGSTAAVAYSYTMNPSETFSNWDTRGDIAISNPLSSGNVYTITVTSTGPGRGKLIFYSSAGGCGPTPHDLIINKTFPQPADSQFLGPDCVELGKTYGFVVPPLVSTPALINAQIGIDTYTWGTDAGAFPGNFAVDYSGDHSALALTLPTAGFTGNSLTLRVTIGGCNTAYMTKTIYVKPRTVTLIPGGAASCKTDFSAFTFTFSVETGVTYVWNGIPTGWSLSLPNSTPVAGGVTYATAGTQTATITPNSAVVADISVTAKNSGGGECAASTSNAFRVSRQLTTTNNPITPSLTGCLTPGASVTFTVASSLLPANTIFDWQLPAGWPTTTDTDNSITVTVPANVQAGDVTVRVAGCGTGGSTLPVKVSGENGCSASTYLIERYGSQKKYFEVTNPNNPGCEQGTGAGISYEWSSTNNPNPQHITISTPYVTFANAEVVGQSVNVIIRNSANCLEVNVGGTVNRMALGSTSATSSAEPLVAYPNPAGNELHVDLDLKKGAAQLMLTDMLGRTVQQTSTKEAHTRLDVREVPTGTYTLRAVLPDGKSVGKTVQVKH
ncbi:T9SS type A sorting domain-containing protein [Hymenobacter negativus]|uniref:T9SS type A sorting domain-containing protein n=1 Tax=Hymenobacter negativus TaxID=2795026 RepID=A0ABS3QDB0_9BACT|nr:T9SS type A sorting domain-containing protein [Hymenobacter negativus]MBO2009229.1 T9SS type A sorting domain-containing protein [Hymenobacter negativus]